MSQKFTTKRKMRHYLILPEYQMHYVYWVVMAGALLTALNGFIFYTFTRTSYMVLLQSVPLLESTQYQLLEVLKRNTIGLAVGAFVIMVITMVAGVYISHRTAGPVFQLQRLFKEVAEGDFKVRARFRRKDEFLEIANDFNKMMDRVEKEVT